MIWPFCVSDTNLTRGPKHDLYWTFEAILLPTFLVVTLLLFRRYFRRSTISAPQWKKEAILFGAIIMVTRFVLDTMVLVLLMGSGFQYFVALVTVTYLTIPAWAYLAAHLWKPRPSVSGNE